LQLEELNTQVHRLKIPDDEDLQSCYQSLLDGINTENAFQKSITSYLQNPANLSAKSDFEKLSKETFIDNTLARTSILTLLLRTNADLYEKISYVWNTDSK
jgi:uncharacterized protein YbaP (TraB family)